MSRLTQTDWIAAGFRALTTRGPQALKAEPLARDLGTTKGSFYWHFKDVPAFQEQMLSHWEEEATQDIIVALDPIPTPAAKLRALSQLATTRQEDYSGVGAEPAIRAWARADKNVAAALARVDTTRTIVPGSLTMSYERIEPVILRGRAIGTSVSMGGSGLKRRSRTCVQPHAPTQRGLRVATGGVDLPLVCLE